MHNCGEPGSAEPVAVLVAVPGVHVAAVAEPWPAVARQAAVDHVMAVAELVPVAALQAVAQVKSCVA